MAEIRVKETGTIKLFESDNTSSVTIASPASLGADRTITLPDGDVTLVAGTMSTGGVALTGSTDNTVTTVTGADAIQGEASMTYDGTTLALTTSGGGLKLDNLGSSNANTLDDYEEGVWTPAFAGIGTGATYSYGQQHGAYTKIGRTVHYSMRIALNASPTGTTSNAVKLTGLPFTNLSNSTTYYFGCSGGYFFAINLDGNYQLAFQIMPGAAEMQLKETGDDTGELSIIASQFNSNAEIRVSWSAMVE